MDSILARRLHNQFISRSASSPYEVVKHLTCIQSQDLTQAKRAIASRCGCAEQDIVDAFHSGKIVRTWTQRGTIHTVAAEDAGRIVKLCASKTLSGFKRRREFLGIDDDRYDRALGHLQDYLSSGPKSRKDIGGYLEQSGISIQSGRLYNILCYAGSIGLVVQGPFTPLSRGLSAGSSTGGGKPEGFEQAFVLTSQWIKNPKQYADKEAVRELCLRYFASHGPATIDDFARWSGLGKTVIKQGIADCGEQLEYKEIDGKIYYCRDVFLTRPHQGNAKSISLPSTGLFLAGFDEFLLGYKDRSHTVHNDHLTKIDVSRNGVFKPTVMIDGETIGTRSIKHKAKVSEIHIKPFETLNNDQISLLQEASTRYADYSAKEIVIHIV